MKSKEDNEDLALRRIVHRLLLIESLEAHQDGEHFDIATAGSKLADDDALMGRLQTSHLIGHCLSVSLDALRTARFVLQSPTKPGGLRLPMIGHYAILRTAVESAALAVWLLGPDDRRERITRSLSARWSDVLHDDKLVLVFTEALATDSKADVSRKQRQRRENSGRVRELKKKIRELARSADIPEDKFNYGLPGFGPIIAEASEEIDIASTYARGSWHFVSGLTHPSMSRSISGSNVEFTAGPDEDIGRARLTANPATVNMALDSAILMYKEALSITARRGGNADLEWKPGPEVPLPPGFKLLSDGTVTSDD